MEKASLWSRMWAWLTLVGNGYCTKHMLPKKFHEGQHCSECVYERGMAAKAAETTANKKRAERIGRAIAILSAKKGNA